MSQSSAKLYLPIEALQTLSSKNLTEKNTLPHDMTRSSYYSKKILNSLLRIYHISRNHPLIKLSFS